MAKVLRILFITLYIPVFLVLFAVIHELGHTIIARVLGDPASYFTLVRIDETGMCLGCNVYDANKLGPAANALVSLGGLLATQTAAWVLLGVSGLVAGYPFWERLLRRSALAFAFLDVIVQGVQGLLYDLSRQVFPTNVDLVDFMLLVSATSGAGQTLMKIVLALVSLVYLVAFVRAYRRVAITVR